MKNKSFMINPYYLIVPVNRGKGWVTTNKRQRVSNKRDSFLISAMNDDAIEQGIKKTPFYSGF